MPDINNKSKAQRLVNRIMLDKVTRYIIEYVNAATISELVILAVILVCALLLASSLVVPKFVLVVFTLIFVMCCISFAIFHYNTKNIDWIVWILNVFSDFIFEQSSYIIKKHLVRSDRDSLARSLIDSLKLLSLCGAICSLSLSFLTALNMSPNNVPSRYTPTPPVSASPVSAIIQSPISTPSIKATLRTPTISLTDTVIIPFSLHYTPSPQPNITTVTTIIPQPDTIIPTKIITDNAVIKLVQIQPIIENYLELLNTISPRLVIVEVKSFDGTTDNLEVEQDEQIVIVNYGDRIDISDWYVTDNQGHRYHFKNFYLSQASAARLHTGKGIDTNFDLYWNQEAPIWVREEPHLILYDKFDAVVDRW